MNGRRTHLIAYDVRSPRRLARVARALTECGHRQQYSVFAADLTEPARAQLMARLRKLIDPAADDLRIYLIPDAPRGGWFGRLPQDDAAAVLGAAAANLAARLKMSGGQV
ncbi:MULTISPECIES: CRISPR-associated endonuclease Cas2 [unclassified Bradyrhizobium]|uniref:CRISPR-associated endonuclease Cas2 n=1 Tax=unclassified Bradyrhizobium TaxID=2631580 RepID=UPI0028F0A4D6|nr:MULTISPECIES: CRISPR-associated endonuclease Cas2 [unclassified Bradyrhizobium]